MTVKDLAVVYGMSVSELCKKIGYSPQGLNRILRSECVVYPARFRQALCHLLCLSVNIEEDEKRQSRVQGENRFELLDKLASDKGVKWKPNQQPFDDDISLEARPGICWDCDYWLEKYQMCEHPEQRQDECGAYMTPPEKSCDLWEKNS